METWNTQFEPSSNFNDINTPAQDGDKNCQDPPTNPEQLIEDFSSYTTLHGFHFILDAGFLWRRLLWIILVLAGFMFLIVQVWNSVQRLNAKEVITSKSVEVAESLPFPAVTICNQNFMKKSKIMGTVAQDYLDRLDAIKFIYSGQKPKDVPSFDVGKTLQEAGHGIKYMVHSCTFAGVPCNYKEFVPVAPSFYNGLCYSFAGNGSLKNVDKGRFNGLNLRLNVESHEYYGPYSYEATGFRIAIHEPDSYHKINEQGYDISPGFYTSIRIKRKKTISMPPPYPSKCGSKKLFNFERYTQRSCLFECWSQTFATECKCRIIGMSEKGINITRYCNTTEIIQCSQKVRNIKITPEACDCPLECESIEYGIQTSMAYFPSPHLLDSMIPYMAIITGLNASDPEQKAKVLGFIRKEIVVVNIFFENLLTDVTEEKQRYTLSNFGTDIGGNMGLFLGCSLLTIFEFIDLIVMFCIKQRRKRKARVSGKSHNDQIQMNKR